LSHTPATGLPPFASIQGGGFDSVNLQNLNITFAIPVVSHPGRGISFNYALAYNSLLYARVSNGSTASWSAGN
jgi:hypothetical protein